MPKCKNIKTASTWQAGMPRRAISLRRFAGPPPSCFAIDIGVLRGRSLPRKDAAHGAPPQPGNIVGTMIPRAQRPSYRVVKRARRLIPVLKSRPGMILFVEILDRIVKPAHGMNDGKTPVTQTVELI